MGALSRLTGLDRANVGGSFGGAAASGLGAAVFAVMGIAFFATALYNALVPGWGPAGAALIVGAVSLVVALVLGLVAMVLVNRAKENLSRAVRTSAAVTFAPAALSFLSRRAGTFGAIAAIAAGFLVGRNRL